MLHRLNNNITESMLPESQCGFRKNRSTVNMIFTVLQLQEKCREQHKDLFIAFIDLSKAFDIVNRELLWSALSKFGCQVCGVLAPVLFSIFLLFATHLLQKELEDSSGVAVDYRVDGNLFDTRRLQAANCLQRGCLSYSTR